FSPSIYQSDDRLGELYTLIARKVIASTQKQ
ncbi:ATP-binding protein, partial [Paenibacillus macerans]